MRAICLSVITSTAFLLTACVGGGGGGETSFDAMASRGESLINKMEELDVTPVSAMPTAGSATYEGVAGFAERGYDEIEVLSEATLTANFSSSTISGKLTNFRDYQNTKIPGSVSVANGIITGNEFDADLSGSLTVDGSAETVSGNMEGAFGGTNASMLAGVIEGSVGSEDFVGIVGAEK